VERIAGGEKPDVTLPDWLMPLMDGGEVLSRLGWDGGLAAIQVIVISGQPSPAPETKPVSVEDLVTYIHPVATLDGK
jgi:CheY-like chemotaxis protein